MMSAEGKWHDLVEMAERENEDGDYDAILYANRIVQRAGDVEGITKFITEKFKCKDHDSVQGFGCSNCGNISVHDRDWRPIARTVSAYLKEGK